MSTDSLFFNLPTAEQIEERIAARAAELAAEPTPDSRIPSLTTQLARARQLRTGFLPLLHQTAHFPHNTILYRVNRLPCGLGRNSYNEFAYFLAERPDIKNIDFNDLLDMIEKSLVSRE
jgi:hypothetical protein